MSGCDPTCEAYGNSRPVLSIGALVPSASLPAWQADLLSVVANLPGITVELIPIAIPPHSGRLWRRIAARTVALKPSLLPAPLACVAKHTAADAANLRWDILLDLSGTTGDITKTQARRGLWRLIDGYGRPLVAPFLSVEAITSKSTGEVVLIQEDAHSVVQLRHARFAAGSCYEAAFSRHYTIAVQLVRQALIDIAHDIDTAAPYLPPKRVKDNPLRIWTCLMRGQLRAAFRKFRGLLFAESWMIGWVNRPIGDLASAPLPLDIHWLKPRTMHRYLADPFGVPGATDRIYCEELDENDNRGRIKEITVSADRIQSEVDIDLGIPGHLSYPYLFRLGGELYCLPESEATRRCQLFVHDAARGWRPFATILENVAAADPTIFQWEGRFWLAYTDSDQSPHDNLCLYYANDLSGPWSPHINNPVKIDVSSSRPAGTPFFSGSTLYRPAQDCSQTYGGAVALNRVIDCTPTRYLEETVRVLHPPSGINPHGLHTVSAWGERTLVDGKRHIVNPVVLLRKLRQRWPSRKMEFAKDVNETA